MKILGKLIGSVAIMATVATATSAFADDDVRLRLNWMYYGSHAGFAYGKDKGIYKAAGINLDIRSGTARVPPIGSLLMVTASFLMVHVVQ